MCPFFKIKLCHQYSAVSILELWKWEILTTDRIYQQILRNASVGVPEVEPLVAGLVDDVVVALVWAGEHRGVGHRGGEVGGRGRGRGRGGHSQGEGRGQGRGHHFVPLIGDYFHLTLSHTCFMYHIPDMISASAKKTEDHIKINIYFLFWNIYLPIINKNSLTGHQSILSKSLIQTMENHFANKDCAVTVWKHFF